MMRVSENSCANCMENHIFLAAALGDFACARAGFDGRFRQLR